MSFASREQWIYKRLCDTGPCLIVSMKYPEKECIQLIVQIINVKPKHYFLLFLFISSDNITYIVDCSLDKLYK